MRHCQFETSGTFKLEDHVYKDLDVAIEYDHDPEDAKIVDAEIRIKIGGGPEDVAIFKADDGTIDILNNENGSLIYDLASEHAREAYEMQREEERFERHIRSEIMRGLK